MIRRPPRSTRTDTLLPYTSLFRSTDVPRALSFSSIVGRPFSGGQFRGDARHVRALELGQGQFLRRRTAAAVAAGDGAGAVGRAALELVDLGELRRRVGQADHDHAVVHQRSEEHTSELQSLMRISYAVF